jgi:hypothetical protein
MLLLAGMDATRDAAIQRDQDLLKRIVNSQAWDGMATAICSENP